MSLFQHPDAHAFWQAILAAPDDDAPRLVFADWLDENGFPERAEYLRLCCHIDRHKFADATLPLRTRREQLWDTLRYELQSELPNIADVQWTSETWARGFCHGVRLPNLTTFRKHMDTIIASAPVTEWVFTSAQPLDQLHRQPALRQARALVLSFAEQHCDDDLVTELLRSPHLEELHALGLGSTRIGEGAIQAIITSPACATLRVLDLFLTDLQDGVRLLGDATHFTAIEELNIHSVKGRVHDFDAIANAPSFATLKRLRIGPPFGAAGIRAIGQSATMRHLKHLAIVRTNEGLACVQALTASKNFADLRELELICGIENRGAEELAYCPHLAGLQALSFSSGEMTQSGLLALVRSPYLHKLRQLSIENNPLSAKVARALLDAPHLANLELLWLDSEQPDLPETLHQALKDRFGLRYRHQRRGLYR